LLRRYLALQGTMFYIYLCSTYGLNVIIMKTGFKQIPLFATIILMITRPGRYISFNVAGKDVHLIINIGNQQTPINY
jgi:hypothetical protein